MLIKRLSLTVMLIMVFLFNSVAFAVETDKNVGTSDNFSFISQSTQYLAEFSDGTRIVAAYRTTENGPVKLSKEEFQSYIDQIKSQQQQIEKLKQIEKAKQSETSFYPESIGGVPVKFYDERGKTEKFHHVVLNERISNYVVNRRSETAYEEITAEKTQSTTANFKLSSNEKSAFKLETGLQCDCTYTFRHSMTTPIPPKTKCWIEFYPIMHNSWGLVQSGVTTTTYPYYVITSEKFADIYRPRRLPYGQLDGTYLLWEEDI